uniref:C2H2-type domain-containing protein n=1 Tax=Tetraodon nigroviridis TaxID=99883 RepID=H3D647_TETNG
QHVCRFCGKVLSSDSSLQIHLRSHTGERPYQCPVCLSRFTTRGNLKAHFLRHREQNPELSLSLLPPALSEQTHSGSTPGTVQRRRKRRADDDESFNGVKGTLPGITENMSLGFLSGTSARPSPSSLPLPPSVDMALLSTAHSLLQLNRASAAAAAGASTSSGSSTSSSMSSHFKGAKQQRFDENTPPHSSLHAASPYSQLAHLPKILFPGGASPHHLQTSDTSKLQRLVHSNSTSAAAASPNQCGVCLRVLSCPRALRLHQATHLGERPFPCKLCGRSFSTKGSLRAHLATHRARPANSRALNSCPLCPRKFTNALVLQHHIRLHLGGQIP